MNYLKDYHYDKLTYTDDSKKEYRLPEELSSVYSGIENATLALSKEVIEEEEANGLDISKDEVELSALLTRTLHDATIIQRIYDKIDKFVSDLP